MHCICSALNDCIAIYSSSNTFGFDDTEIEMQGNLFLTMGRKVINPSSVHSTVRALQMQMVYMHLIKIIQLYTPC